jgi:hypothetical protein
MCSERVFPSLTRSGHPTAVPRRAVQAPPTLPKPQRTLICIKVRCGRARANLGNRHLCVIIGVLLVALAFRLKKHTMVALRNGR